MGTMTNSPKDVVREMAQSGYITNVDLWLKAIDMRNLYSYIYKEDLAEQVYTFAASFLAEFKTLSTKLENT